MHTYDLPLLLQLEAEAESKRAISGNHSPLERWGLGKIARRRLLGRIKEDKMNFPCWYKNDPTKNNEHVSVAMDELFSTLVGLHEHHYPTAGDFFACCSGGDTKKKGGRRTKSPGTVAGATADGSVDSVVARVEVRL
jgi:hypothetical protein